VKKATIIIGFITALSITTADVFKFTHLPGAGTALYLTGLLLSVFFALFILDKMSEMSGGRTLPSHIAAALSAMLCGLGVTFRIWHWPGADVLLILGLCCFSLVFIPMLLIQKSKDAGADNIRNGAAALGFMAFGLGTLFKLEHWPGAPILLSVLLVALFLVYFPRYIMDKTIEPETKHRYLRNSFFTIVIGSLIALYFIKSIETHDLDNVPGNPWYEHATAGGEATGVRY
jgi:hypothetical protein